MTRALWRELPPDVRAAVAHQAKAEIASAADAEAGADAHLAAWLQLDDGQAVFVKGARLGSDAWEPLDHEAAVAPYLPACAPRLLWRVNAAGWDLLGYDLVQAREWADYRPGSADLGLVADALAETGVTAAPTRLPEAWDRWGYWCTDDDRPLFTGNRLVHADPAAANVMVDGERAWLVDWAWAVRGPAWIDPMLFGFRLVADGGHTPAQAADVIRTLPGYFDGNCRARMILTRAEALSLKHAADQPNPHPDTPELVAAANAWAAHWTHDLTV